ncbi:MAG: hypothetical protein WD230_05020, partial [Cucumibacter sp.]
QKYEMGSIRFSGSWVDQVAKALGVEPGYFYAGWDGHLSGLSEKEQQKLLGDRAGIVRLTAAFEQITDEAARRNLVELAEQLAAREK